MGISGVHGQDICRPHFDNQGNSCLVCVGFAVWEKSKRNLAQNKSEMAEYFHARDDAM